MRTKRTDPRKPTLKRETIRRLDQRELGPDDLQWVGGGTGTRMYMKTKGCPTLCE